MSNAGKYIKSAMGFVQGFEEGKAHSSITDWIEVLSSDRYDELSLDGIPELVESINILGPQGTTEASRAIRKKLKYGNVHRQLRALIILRALTENAGHGFQMNWANHELVNRLKDMANDSLLDPKVKKTLIVVFHAWAIQYKDEPRLQHVAALYKQYGAAGPGIRKPTPMAPASSVTSPTSPTYATTRSASTASTPAPRGGFNDDIWSHDWQPAPGKRGPDTYADLAAAKADAEERKRQREQRIILEQREAEIERREREQKRQQEMAALEARRQKEAAEEAERRRQAKENLKNQKAQPKRPPFNLERERPSIMISIANALQAANSLINSCRLLNREQESVTESPKVQENLDKAKAARRTVIRYIQQVQSDEALIGTLLDANEKVVEAIQLYDKLSKPAVLDSDSDSEAEATAAKARDMEALNRKMEAAKLEADRTGELTKLQERQKRESERQRQRRTQRPTSGHPDLQDLDFGSISNSPVGGRLPAPIRPDDDRSSYGGTLSDFSDYDSSDEEWRAARSRRQSVAKQPTKQDSVSYRSLEDDQSYGRKGLLDPNDPFGDPFADDELETPVQERPRMQWTEI